ncbi:alkyl sulfatase dimerization domain-containing protein [Nannocystaceae bacterium ST9]
MHARNSSCWSWLSLSLLVLAGCPHGRAIEQTRVVPTPAMLADHCATAIGERRIERFEFGEVSLLVAIGYDLANTIVIHGPRGNVIVDAMSSPERATEARRDLLAAAPGPVLALILTHSHIDHVGGATTWAPLPDGEASEAAGVEVWATEAFTGHFFDQYGVFQKAEQTRGRRQFGARVSEADLPCSALGARPDFEAEIGAGVRLPTKTFSGSTTLELGGVTIELIEAHGETDDQLFVWLPAQKVLLPGDNLYHAFPNLYTIRGTKPRPVGEWIASLDAMRRLEPELLIGSHTVPIVGSEPVASALRDYRDAIAWLRASVIRAANAGRSREQIAEDVALPEHLAEQPLLRELYGQLDWSALSIYDAELGWFDGRPERLYPLASAELAAREIELMGGVEAVRAAARASDDPRFALHLIAKLRISEVVGDNQREAVEREYAEALRAVAGEVYNTNGRGYLLESAIELEQGPAETTPPTLSDEFLREVPVELFFAAMPARLKLDQAGGVHETLQIDLRDLDRSVWVTVRHGVVEVAWAQAFPGTPEPIARLTTDSLTWKRIALQLDTAGQAVLAGKLEIDGPLAGVQDFFARFDRGI